MNFLHNSTKSLMRTPRALLRRGNAALRRGFTVVETVVAMAIVLMMTAAGIAACTVALKIQNNAVNSERVYNLCDEFVSAFHAASVSVSGSDSDGETEFERAFYHRLVFALGSEEGLTYEQENGAYKYAASGVTVTATISESESVRTISVEGRVSGLSKAVYEKSFTAKGGE